jgi:hypothetical protein
MQSPSQKKLRGISGVVIAVLLTVIGIAAVLMFWGMMSGIISPPQPKVVIEKATIIKIGQIYDVSITVREIGGASTIIEEVRIFGPNLNNQGESITITSTQGSTGSQSSTGGQPKPVLSPGSSITITGTLNKQLQPGVTYYVAVYYKKGDIIERSDLYPVTVR